MLYVFWQVKIKQLFSIIQLVPVGRCHKYTFLMQQASFKSPSVHWRLTSASGVVWPSLWLVVLRAQQVQ